MFICAAYLCQVDLEPTDLSVPKLLDHSFQNYRDLEEQSLESVTADAVGSSFSLELMT